MLCVKIELGKMQNTLAMTKLWIATHVSPLIAAKHVRKDDFVALQYLVVCCFFARHCEEHPVAPAEGGDAAIQSTVAVVAIHYK